MSSAEQTACEESVTACGLEPTSTGATVAYPPSPSGTADCPDAAFVQPCDWQTNPENLGSPIYTAPNLPIDEAFPEPCRAG